MEKMDITIVEACKHERPIEQPPGWKGSSHFPTTETVLMVRYEAKDTSGNEYRGSVDVAWPLHVPPTDKLIEGAIRADITRQRNVRSDVEFVQSLKGRKLGGA